MFQKGLVSILIDLLIALGIGGYFIYQKQKPTAVPQQVTQTASAPTPNPESTNSAETANWKIYTVKIVKLEFKLPEELSRIGDLEETIDTNASKGTKLCIRFKQKTSWLIKEVYAGGDCFSDNPSYFRMGGISPDYEAGRSGNFEDFFGFKKEGDKYFAKFVQNQLIDITQYVDKNYKNPNGVEMVKIKGDSPPVPGYEMGYPLFGSLGKEWMGAIINTNNSIYPGLSVQMKIKNSLTEEKFDQILSTFKFLP